MMNYRFALLALALISLAVGCQEKREEATQEKKESDSPKQEAQGKKAVARVNPTQGNKVFGVVTFVQGADGVRILADVGGLKPGKHGFHIHEHGDCSAPDASSAGAHFNPAGKKHGGPDSQERHVGDLGNLEANELGIARYERVDKVIELDGDNSLIGKSIMIHEGEDDLQTDPSGNSGARIACGVIEVVE